MKKLVSICLLVLTTLIVLTSCADETQLNRKVLPGSTSGGVISYGLYGLDGEIEKNRHFQIDRDEVFERILAFDNLIEFRREYKLLIFVNYEQICFSVNDQDIAYCYDFVAEPYELTQCKITLPQLKEGFYDLLFIIVKDPNNTSLDDEYRKKTDMSHLTSMRYSLQVGSLQDANNERTIACYDTIDDKTLDGVFLNDDRNELRRLLSLNCKPNGDPELFIHVGNQSDSFKDYVVLLLYDWMQIPVDSQSTLYFSLPKESRTTIGFTPGVLGDVGVHNMAAICIESPFQIATTASRKADFSIRVGVNVEE